MASSAATTPRPRPTWRMRAMPRARPNPTQATPVTAYQPTKRSVETLGLTAQASSWFTQEKAKIQTKIRAGPSRESAAAAAHPNATVSATADSVVPNGTYPYDGRSVTTPSAARLVRTRASWGAQRQVRFGTIRSRKTKSTATAEVAPTCNFGDERVAISVAASAAQNAGSAAASRSDPSRREQKKKSSAAARANAAVAASVTSSATPRASRNATGISAPST